MDVLLPSWRRTPLLPDGDFLDSWDSPLHPYAGGPEDAIPETGLPLTPPGPPASGNGGLPAHRPEPEPPLPRNNGGPAAPAMHPAPTPIPAPASPPANIDNGRRAARYQYHGPALRHPADRNGGLLPSNHTYVLPVAHPAAGSTLASLFGFDETSAAFVTTAEGEGWEDRPEDSAWDLLPSLADVMANEGRGNTGDTIKRLWHATERIDLTPQRSALAGDPMGHYRPRRRGWLWLLAGMAVISAVLFAGKTFIDRSAQAVTERQGLHAEAAQDLAAALDPVEELLSRITAGEAVTVASLTSELGSLDGTARQTLALSDQPLPSAPLFGARISVDGLAAEQETLQQASTQTLIMEQRLSNMVSYTQTYAEAFQMPPLPELAGQEELARTTDSLNEAIAQTRITISDLPETPDFAAHRAEAQQTLVLIEALQIEYVKSLRNQDQLQAGLLKTDILQSITDLDRKLAAPQAGVTEWSKGQIRELRTQLADLTPQ